MPRSSSLSSTRRRRETGSTSESPSIFDHSHHAYHRRTLGQHSAHITMLWVVLMSFSLAGGLMILGIASRLNALEQALPDVSQLEAQLLQQEIRLMNLAEAVKQLAPLAPVSSSSPSVPSGSGMSSGSVEPEILLVSQTSPSGALSRGSVSPDGTRFAGYEETTPGKKGIAVELLTETTGRKIRYIVIFNPATQSSGLGQEAFEQRMSVRWKDNQTIEYEVLVKKGGEWVLETSEVQIFF